MKSSTPAILATLLLALAPFTPLAAQMNYQGRLTDAAGAPLPGNTATIRFTLFDAVTGGNQIWGPFDVNADIIEGRFNVVLGPLDSTNRPLDQAFAGGTRFLQITLFSSPNTPITPALPRQQILASPSALNAATLGAADRKITVTRTGSFGTANGFSFSSEPGLLMENVSGGEGGGVFVNGQSAVIFSPGDEDILKIYDEDNLPGGPKFRVLDGDGGIATTGPAAIGGGGSFAGNLSVTGNITAGSITGTLNTPSLSLSGSLAVAGASNLAQTFITGNVTINGGVGAVGQAGVVIGAGGSSGQFPFLIRDRLNQDYITTFSDGANANFSVLRGIALKPGGGSWTATSDRRLKKNIHDLGSSLDTLSRLHPVTFEYKNPERQGISGMQRGFIAQEVAEVFPEWVNDVPNDRERKPGEEEEPAVVKTVSIKGFEALTVDALKELRAEKDAQIQSLKSDNAALEARLAALEAKLTRALVAQVK